MRVFRSTAAPAFVLALVLAACGGGTASTDEPDAGTDTDPSVAAPEDGTGDGSDGSAEGDAASVEVTVSGGAFEGTYSGSVADGGCSRGATGENTFGLQYSTDQDVELSSLQLVANDASAASSGGSDDFMTTLTFGDLLSGTSVDINPPESEGTGTVSIDDRGDTATISIEGETSDGAMIDATVECHSVFDFGG
jgi:hypothetical protein